jgi:UDP-N-acetyl-D-mannosaminouronate:lipid I N-acetyl-D-mannosaminouronosyltransferase
MSLNEKMEKISSLDRIHLNGAGIFPFNSHKEVLEYIKNKKKILIAINAEKILSNDLKIKEIINDNIGYPDGIGAVIALRRKGIRAKKIAGALLWLEIVKKYYQIKKFYLIGSTQEIIEKTYENLKIQFPQIAIVNYRNGYFPIEELSKITKDLKEKKPDIVFVAMGSPKQEFIMSELIKVYPALYMGLGGSFDLYCGKAKMVPEWWNRIFKWEGLYRTFNDFYNLKRWKRQVPVLRIIYKVLFNKL